ncbi:unnamed protein product [Brassica rapa subsp. narinosa]
MNPSVDEEMKKKKKLGNGVVGILAESVNKWERRTPLTPSHCSRLLQDRTGVSRIVVQPSAKRIYHDALYSDVGCEISDDLSDCGLILCIKQPKLEMILPERAYAFFSHIHRAQKEKMPLLDKILSERVTLYDYELIVGDHGKRLLAFGIYAGRAGLVDFLHGLGQRYLSQGYSTPFLSLGSSYMYPSLAAAKAAVISVGEEISSQGLPLGICPLVFVFTGTGNVSRGAQEMFKLLPHAFVEPSNLPGLFVKDKGMSQNGKSTKRVHQVYGCIITSQDMVEHQDPSKSFDKADYYAHPEHYNPVFHDKIAPYTSVLVNCMYWEKKFPRLLSTKQVQDLAEKGCPLVGICDITCDIGGSVEFVNRATSIDSPFFRFCHHRLRRFQFTIVVSWLHQNGAEKHSLVMEIPIGATVITIGDHGEGLQVLHYEEGQKYEPHYDYFVDEFNTKNGGQRMATMLMYLTDVEEGGETVFPAANMNFSSVPWYNVVKMDFPPTVDNKPPSKGKNRTGIIVGVIVGLGLLSILAGVGIFIIRKRRKPTVLLLFFLAELLSMEIKPFTFTYSELKSATQDFNLSNKLEEGGFEPVYKVQTQMIQFSLKSSQVVDLLLRNLSSGSYHFTRLRGNFRSTGRSVGVEAQLTHLSSITQIIDPKLHQHLDKLGGGDYLCAIQIVLLHVIDDSSDSDENCRVTTEGTLTRRFWRVNTRVVVKVTLAARILTLSVTVERREEVSQTKRVDPPTNVVRKKSGTNMMNKEQVGRRGMILMLPSLNLRMRNNSCAANDDKIRKEMWTMWNRVF